MLTTDERFQQLIEKIRLMEKHIATHWVEGKKSPPQEEIKILHEEMRFAIKELQDLYRTIKVFKTI